MLLSLSTALLEIPNSPVAVFFCLSSFCVCVVLLYFGVGVGCLISAAFGETVSVTFLTFHTPADNVLAVEIWELDWIWND